MRLHAIAAALMFAVVLFAADSPSANAQTPNGKKLPANVVVKPGDSLAKISSEHETTYTRVFDANPKVEDPDLIYAGDSLRIPAPDEKLASRSVPAPPAPAPAQSTPAAQAAPAQRAQPQAGGYGGVWDSLAQCESGGNWGINTGNGFYGGLQFTMSSWRAVGGSGYPHLASKAEQIARAQSLQAIQGWGAWPACASKLGLR